MFMCPTVRLDIYCFIQLCFFWNRKDFTLLSHWSLVLYFPPFPSFLPFAVGAAVACGVFHCSTQTLSLWRTGSVVVAHQRSCSVVRGILVPRRGIERMSPALRGEFPVIGSPGETLNFSTSLYKRKINWVTVMSSGLYMLHFALL